MQEIKLCRLEKWIKGKGTSIQCGKVCALNERVPCVIVGAPCSCLLELQKEGYCVLAELAYLQGLSEETVTEALCKEEAVQQYEHVCIDASELPQAYLRRIWCKSLGQPAVISETSRLLIRESVAEDAEAFAHLYQDKECRRYLELPVVELETESDDEQRKEAYRRYIVDYQKGQYAFWEYGMWSVVEKESGAVVGRAGLEQQETVYKEVESVLSLGYAILPEFRGKGYAVEACLAILEYCKECEYAERVTVTIDKENLASRKVFDRLQEKACMPLKLIFK